MFLLEYDTLLPMRNSNIIFFLTFFPKLNSIPATNFPSYLLLKENRWHEAHKEEKFKLQKHIVIEMEPYLVNKLVTL